MRTLTCSRCLRPGPAVEEVPYSGELGREVRDRICAGCWADWQQAEVMVINELRLDFMDPKSDAILMQQMREFLCLDRELPNAE